MPDRAGSSAFAESFAGAVAVVTGAGGQIGRALVEKLTKHGATVIALDLPAACPSGDDRYLPCDVTDEEQVRSVVAEVERRHGRVDLLVHSAGLSAIGRFEDHDVATHRRVMEVTHLGVVSLTLAALPLLRTARGRVVLIGSVAGFAPVLGRPPYVAAKHAVTGLFETLRPELAEQGVAVTVCHPTFVTGGMAEAVGREQGHARVTSGEELTPDDVADALLDGVARGRELVLVGRTARRAWILSRHLPRTYRRIMTRRLRSPSASTAPPTGDLR
jgi:NAD(P)-dependent dehydrogenase (short-subunit alcohol dehydrogenase family)